MVSLLEKKIEEMQLEEMQLQFKETEKMLVKEQEAVKEAANLIPVIQEVPVIDSVLLDKLTFENEQLKAMVSSLEKKIDETERKYEETHRLSEERLKQTRRKALGHGDRGYSKAAGLVKNTFVISVTKEGVKFSTRGDIGSANIVCRQNNTVDKVSFHAADGHCQSSFHPFSGVHEELKAFVCDISQATLADFNQLCLNLGLQALQPFDATRARSRP